MGSEGKADAFVSILNPVPGWVGPRSRVPQALWNSTSPLLGHTQSLVELRSCFVFLCTLAGLISSQHLKMTLLLSPF